MDLLALSESISEKKISPKELVEQSLEKIKETNQLYNTYITINEDEARTQAVTAEKEISVGDIRSPLHGVPIAIKDVVYTKGLRTTMGSEIYKDFVPDDDATVVKQLKDAGAIIIGKTHTHEFAFGPTGDKSYFGPCKNPYNTNKITGGSSSGSAVSVATDTVSLAIGTDTGGSIRIPASACGVVGMKPTFGLISKYGIHNTAYSLDHPGPITKTIKDNAILLDVLAGYDQKDSDSLLKSKEDYTRLIGKEIKGKVIGLPSYFFSNIDEEIRKTIDKVIDIYKGLGAEIINVELESMEEIAASQIITIQSEAAAIHEEHMNNRSSEFGQEILKRLQMSSNVSGYKYVQAQRRKQAYISSFNRIFKEVDVLLTPTLPVLATDIDQREVSINGENVEQVRNALLRLTSPINYTGNPAISIPCGMSADGLPIGFQLIGKHQTESLLYQVGYAYEEATQV